MSGTLVTPENEIFPDRKRWSRKECEKIEKLGVMPERYELIDGEIISKMAQNPPHNVTLNRFILWFILVFGAEFLRNQQDISISGRNGKYNSPQPDIAVTVGSNDDYETHHPAPSELVLLVEISDTTLRRDKTTKAQLYAQSGVLEYWVANVAKREIIRHRKPKRTGYAEIVTLGPEEMLSPEGRPENSIRVGDLFPPPAIAE